MKLVTHSGQFHADDVFATAILLLLYPKAKVSRTRDVKKLKPSRNKIIYDVGNKYSHSKGIYDHHQKNGAGKRTNGVPYAAVGLIWKHFGKLVVSKFSNGKNINKIHKNLDQTLFCGIDAEDNGVLKSNNHLVGNQEIAISNKSLGAVISGMYDSASPSSVIIGFEAVVNLAKQYIILEINKAVRQEEAKSYLAKADKKGAILVMEELFPWQEFAVGKPHILFVVYPANNAWYCQAVPKVLGSFETRKPLPQAWAGLTEGNLREITKVTTATFCHNNLFICGAQNKIDAVKLGNLAI